MDALETNEGTNGSAGDAGVRAGVEEPAGGSDVPADGDAAPADGDAAPGPDEVP